ncbi:3-deoxy-D-manno-octulosonic acid transferase [Opitutaceae bacterium EW11]|nr:3-deoxy-D-manno-octulosonic acid transferase [Opitutaceae bacterium EW11]
MLWLYRLLFLPALIVASPFYLARMRRRGGYKRHFGQRFGSVPKLPAREAGVVRIWLQAVSVGEMLAIAPLLDALKKDPDVEVYLTTTTSTGYKLARERYHDRTIAIAYFPLDWWLFSLRAWWRVKPDLVILTEGERWPEHVRQAANRRVPVICVNARLSDRSFGRMKRWSQASRSLLSGMSRILACSEFDAQRFRELGFENSAITTTGNIKLDLTIPALTEEERTLLREELGFVHGSILLGSSTWPGEEAALLKAWRKLQDAGFNCRLLLVPRHAERRNEIEALLQDAGVRHHFRSRGAAKEPFDVTVADTTGELRRLAQLADLIFVGKSLPPHDQGQTPVEAAALGKPIVFGPGMSNFRVIARELLGAGAARAVNDPAQLAGVVLELFQEPQKRRDMAEAAQKWHRANQGAMQRTLAVLSEEIAKARKASASM